MPLKGKLNFKASGAAGFCPHHNRVFYWKDLDGQEQQGWFYCANEFFNVPWTNVPSTIEIAPVVLYNDFGEYIDDTLQDRTPHLKPEIVGNMQFEPCHVFLSLPISFRMEHDRRILASNLLLNPPFSLNTRT